MTIVNVKCLYVSGHRRLETHIIQPDLLSETNGKPRSETKTYLYKISCTFPVGSSSFGRLKTSHFRVTRLYRKGQKCLLRCRERIWHRGRLNSRVFHFSGICWWKFSDLVKGFLVSFIFSVNYILVDDYEGEDDVLTHVFILRRLLSSLEIF